MNGFKSLLCLGALISLTACDVASEGDALTHEEFGALGTLTAEDFGAERAAAFACVMPQETWVEHNVYTDENLAWPVDEEFEACGQTIYEWMVSEEDDAFTELAQAWLTTLLNETSGAPMPADIKDVFFLAGDELETCEVSSDDWAFELAKQLNTFNNGEAGVPSCGEDELSLKY